MIGEQRPGDWRVICAKSGFKVWASDCVKDPVSGFYVLRRFADERNPQSDRTGIPDDPSVPWSQPEGTDTFIVTPITADDL